MTGMNKNNNTTYKTIMETLAILALIIGAIIAWTAMVQYNHGNTVYAIYATGQAVFFGVIAMVLSIMRATKRR